MSEEEIRAQVQKFLTNTDWGEVLSSTHGAGLCYDVSEDFRKWISAEHPGIDAYLVYEHRVGAGRFKGLYPKEARGHWVLLLLKGKWLVDLSARQFCRSLPIPYILNVEHLSY